MFGYVTPDFPNLYLKDDTLYKALYCGICKSIGKGCGQCARFSLTYDVAFMSAVVHNLKGVDVSIKRERCIAHPIIKRPVARPDDISVALGALNVILAQYKILDDIADNGRGRIKKLFLNGGFKRAARAYPELVKIVEDNYCKLTALEKQGEKSIDKTADPFAVMLASLSSVMLEDCATEHSYNFFYNLGKWIYLIDALDDYDKDVKKGNYNPFVCAYGAKDFAELKAKNGEEISFIMSATLQGIDSSVRELKFRFNADLIRNVALKGTVEKTKKVLLKTQANCTKKDRR